MASVLATLACSCLLAAGVLCSSALGGGGVDVSTAGLPRDGSSGVVVSTAALPRDGSSSGGGVVSMAVLPRDGSGSGDGVVSTAALPRDGGGGGVSTAALPRDGSGVVVSTAALPRDGSSSGGGVVSMAALPRDGSSSGGGVVSMAALPRDGSSSGGGVVSKPVLPRDGSRGGVSTDGGGFFSTTEEALSKGESLPLWVQKLLALGCSAPTSNLGNLKGKLVIVANGGGEGHFRSINEALAAAEDPVGKGNKGGRGRGHYIIFIKEGIYEESVSIRRKNVILVGKGMGKSVITWNKSAAFDHLDTSYTATLSVHGSGFMAQDLTIANTIGPAGEQAVALFSRSNHSLVYRCSIEGYQDTLDADTGLQMYLESSIHGTVDFIFGYARAAFLGCRLLVRRSTPAGTDSTQHNVITAQGRDNPKDNSGFVFHNCSVTADDGVNLTGVDTFLGRPWKEHSHVMFMESFLDSIVNSGGWVEWTRNQGQIPETVVYLEYGNTGPGADTSRRIDSRAVRVASCSQAEGYTADVFVKAPLWMPKPKQGVFIPYINKLQHPCTGSTPRGPA